MTINNEHMPNDDMRQRIKDLVVAGIPKHLICKIVKLNDDTLNLHYSYELDCAQAEIVGDISRVVAVQALNGNEKSQALYLKTQAAKYGWVEKQVVETSNDTDTQALKDKVAELEEKYKRDY